MIYHTIWVSIYSFKCFKTVWSGLFTSTLFSPRLLSRLDRNGMLLKFLRILITVMYFKDRNWISKTVNCISYSVVCKIVFCSEFPDTFRYFPNFGKSWQNHERKKEKNTGNCKALCVSRERNNELFVTVGDGKKSQRASSNMWQDSWICPRLVRYPSLYAINFNTQYKDQTNL